MRFHVGPVPISPDFHPDESWLPLKEFSPWIVQLAAYPLGLAVAIFLATVWWVCTPLEELDLSLATIGLSMVLNFVIHEWIHALAHPNAGRTDRTIVGFWPSTLVFYAHYHGPLPRNRLIIILLSPFIVISVVPVCIAVVLQAATGWIAFLSVFNAFGSCVDLYFTGMILAQIPAEAVIRNQGWKTYWKPGNGIVAPAGICRKFHKVFLSVVLPSMLVALVYAEEDLRGWHAWQNFKQAGEAQGEHFDYASIIPPAVPDNLNFALDPVVATSYSEWLDQHGHKLVPPNTNVVNRLTMTIFREGDDSRWPTNGSWARGTITHLNEWQAYYRTPLTNRDGTLTNEFPTSPKPQSAAEDVLLALGKYNSTIEELRSASRLPYSRFPINYDHDHPFDTLIPHLLPEKRCVQVLQIRALAELELGHTEKALDDVQLTFRLVNTLRSEPLGVTHSVRMAQTQIVLQTIYEGLATHKWSDAQLAALQVELARLDFVQDYLFMMRAERNFGLARIEYVGQCGNFQEFSGWRPYGYDNLISRSCESVEYGIGAALFYSLPRGWFYLAQANLGNLHQEWMLKAADANQHQFFPKTADGAFDFAIHRPLTPANALVVMLGQLPGTPALKFAYTQSAVDMAQIGCALERYRLAKGKYPQSLDELAPQFMAQLPYDVIGGKPLKYRREENGEFILYSIGWNGVDDGGTVGLTKYDSLDIEKGDWVWRYPASVARL